MWRTRSILCRRLLHLHQRMPVSTRIRPRCCRWKLVARRYYMHTTPQRPNLAHCFAGDKMEAGRMHAIPGCDYSHGRWSIPMAASIAIIKSRCCVNTTSMLLGNRIMITIATSSDSSRMFLIAYQVRLLRNSNVQIPMSAGFGIRIARAQAIAKRRNCSVYEVMQRYPRLKMCVSCRDFYALNKLGWRLHRDKCYQGSDRALWVRVDSRLTRQTNARACSQSVPCV